MSTVHRLNDNRVFHKECKSLAQAGYDISLIITHDRDEVIGGVKVIGLKKTSSRLKRASVRVFQALRYALKQKADVYHFHDPELIPAGIILKLLGNKVIYDVHENTAQQMLNKEWLGENFRRQVASLLVRVAENISKFFFDVIITARPDIAEHWNCSKVREVINAAVLETIDSAPELEVEKSKPVVIYAGGLSLIRGIKHLIKAMEIVGDRAELWLLGGWESENFREDCEKLESWKHVNYLGYRTVEEVYSYMKKSDISVVTLLPVPNHLTTLPNKPFEYMACKLPVIMSDFQYWREIFGDNVLFANPESSEQIAEQIEKLLDDEELRGRLAKKGRKFVEEKYSWEAERKKLFEIYDSLVRS